MSSTSTGNKAGDDPIVENSRLLIERGSKSFAGAARLFQPSVRAGAYMLYAWCRFCDDEIDGQDLGYDSPRAPLGTAGQRLEGLRDKTIRAMNGDAEEPIFKALQRVVLENQIPHKLPLALLEGMAMDVRGRTYHTIDDTLSYSYHVAGVVGVMMAMVMGVRERHVLDRASDLGLAFQLTNIARDVVPDATIGRVYLPAQWLNDEGIDATPEAIAAPQNREAVAAATRALLQVADRYYASAGHGLRYLPFRSAWAIAAARWVYSDIGTLIRARGPRAWDHRVSVSARRKLAGLGLSAMAAANARTFGFLKSPPSRDGLWTMRESAPDRVQV